MGHRLVVVGIVGFWAVMTATLVRRWLMEVQPEFIPGTYRSLLTAERQNYHTRMGIYVTSRGRMVQVGYTETVFLYTADQKHRITNTTCVEQPAPGLLQKLGRFDLYTTAVVSKERELERFSVVVSSPLLQAECDGQVEGQELVLRLKLRGEEAQVMRFPLPPGGTMAAGLSPLVALPPLRLGLRWSTAVFNPLTLQPTLVEISVLRHETIEWEGRLWDTHVVEIRSGYLKAQAWVSPEGEVLKETSLFGLTLIKQRLPEEAGPKSRTGKLSDGDAATP